MAKRFKGKNAKVCVAVNFDDASMKAVKVAEQYCHRVGAELHLVHVCENIVTAEIASIGTGGMFIMPPEVLEAAEENAKEEARSKMFELSQSIKAPIKVSNHVLGLRPGSIADALESEALSCGADMIIVGASPTSHRFVPRGFSVALSLMSHAKLPVMVVNTKQKADLDSDRLSIVIADDLKSSSNAAVVGGCELAFALGKGDIFHLYVNGVTKDLLEAALSTALASSRSSSDTALSSQEVHAAMLQQFEGRLESRTVGLNMALDITACRYHRELLTDGSVMDAMQSYVDKKKANLIVFGRHQSFHRKPFGVGQMPFYAMLNLGCPVVVFPSA